MTEAPTPVNQKPRPRPLTGLLICGRAWYGCEMPMPDDDAYTIIDWIDAVNSDPDGELGDPEDDEIGYAGDEMAGWDLDGEEDDDDEE